MNAPPHSLTRLDFVLAVFTFVASLALYIRTLAPSLLYGDPAEFQTIAFTLGIGHPTGYPVYILLAKLFTFLPVGDIAYRVNLFSAFCGALAVALTYLGLRQLGAWRAPAVFGALTLALVALFWKHATFAEVYTASAACLAFIVLAVLTWKETKKPRWLFIAGLFGGLSLGIHMMVALSGLAILLFLVLSTCQRVEWIHALIGALSGLALFLLAFLLLDSLNASAGYYNTVVYHALSVWGMTPADFDSPFERLAFLYIPPQFQGQFFDVPTAEVKTRLTDFVSEASWSVWLALLGLIALCPPRKGSPSRWREAILLLTAFLTFLVFAFTYNVYDFYVFYIPALLVMSVFIGLGVNAIVEALALIPKLPRAVSVGLSVILAAGSVLLARDSLSDAWTSRLPPMMDEWESYFYESPEENRLEAEEIVNRLEDNAIVFTDWDMAYKCYYVAHVLRGRVEMDFHETYPQEGVSRLADSTLAYIEANIDARPIYFSERPSELATRYKITRAGSGLFRIGRK